MEPESDTPYINSNEETATPTTPHNVSHSAPLPPIPPRPPMTRRLSNSSPYDEQQYHDENGVDDNYPQEQYMPPVSIYSQSRRQSSALRASNRFSQRGGSPRQSQRFSSRQSNPRFSQPARASVRFSTREQLPPQPIEVEEDESDEEDEEEKPLDTNEEQEDKVDRNDDKLQDTTFSSNALADVNTLVTMETDVYDTYQHIEKGKEKRDLWIIRIICLLGCCCPCIWACSLYFRNSLNRSIARYRCCAQVGFWCYISCWFVWIWLGLVLVMNFAVPIYTIAYNNTFKIGEWFACIFGILITIAVLWDTVFICCRKCRERCVKARGGVRRRINMKKLQKLTERRKKKKQGKETQETEENQENQDSSAPAPETGEEYQQQIETAEQPENTI